MNKDLPIGFSIGLLTGAFIGGVMALLLAPVSGEDARQLIGNKTIAVAEMIKEKAGRVSDAVKEGASEVNQKE